MASRAAGRIKVLFTVDVGNSNIVAGLWDGEKLVQSWRIHTVARKTEDEYSILFRSLFDGAGFDPLAVKKVCLSSVVPSLTSAMNTMLARLCRSKPVEVGPAIYGKLPITVVNPVEVGADLVADAMAAWHKCRGACVVVDFGTALTFTIVDSNAVMRGVAIAPGLGTAVNALSRDTAQLPFVQLAAPPSVLGKNTVHSIQSGVVFGFTGLVEYMVGKIKAELGGGELKVIATGGLCEVLTPLTKVFTYVEPDLTLYGLKLIADIES